MSEDLKKEYIEMFHGVKTNRWIFVSEEKEFVDELLSELGNPPHKWMDGKCRIIKTSRTNKMNDFYELLRNHKYGDILVNMKASHVRNHVSLYNSMHGDKFRVRKIDDKNVILFKDIENYKFIKQSDYDRIKNEWQSKLEDLKTKIMSDDFFEDVPAVTEASDNKMKEQLI